jgi:hypothetical protein
MLRRFVAWIYRMFGCPLLASILLLGDLLPSTLLLTLMLLASLLPICSDTCLLRPLLAWIIGCSVASMLHGLEYCMLSFYLIWLPAATRLDPVAR